MPSAGAPVRLSACGRPLGAQRRRGRFLPAPPTEAQPRRVLRLQSTPCAIPSRGNVGLAASLTCAPLAPRLRAPMHAPNGAACAPAGPTWNASCHGWTLARREALRTPIQARLALRPGAPRNR